VLTVRGTAKRSAGDGRMSKFALSPSCNGNFTLLDWKFEKDGRQTSDLATR